MAKQKSQIIGLDILRLTAAMWVVLFHLAYWAHATPYFSHRLINGYGDYPALARIAQPGWLGVPIFFVISGFVIAFSSQTASPFSFFASRVVRLFPAMLICATLVLAVTLWRHLRPTDDALIAYGRSIVFLPIGPYIDDSFWTLSIEITFYSVIWAMLFWGDFSKIRRVAFAIGSISSGFDLSKAFWFEKDFPADLSRVLDVLLLSHGIYFAIGIFIWTFNAERSKWDLLWIAGLVWVALLQIKITTQNNALATGGNDSIVASLGGFLAFLAIFGASIRWNAALHSLLPKKVASICRVLGLMTYPLYLIHQVCGAYAIGVVTRRTQLPYVSFILVVGGCVVASWFIAVYLEPPLQRLTKTLLHRLSGNGRLKILVVQ